MLNSDRVQNEFNNIQGIRNKLEYWYINVYSALSADLSYYEIWFKEYLINQHPNNETYRDERTSFNSYILRILEGFSRKPEKIHDENDFRTLFYRAFLSWIYSLLPKQKVKKEELT